MKLNIIKNTRRNLLWGTVLKIYQILVPMLIRRVFIYRLGVEYAGLGGLFSSVLNFLNLAEMGVESAVLFFMYKPIAENDTEAVRRLLGLIRRCYQRIGLFVLAAGLIVTPFIRLLISGELPAGINVYAIFLMNLLSSVLSYWLFAYKGTILSVHQRNDLISRTRLSALTIKYVAQLLVLLYVGNYYLYLAVDIGIKLVERFITVLVADRKYPMYKTVLNPTSEMSAALHEKTGSLILHKIGGIIVNSADAVVISASLGLAVLGRYENYHHIMTSVLGFVVLINTSVQAGIGNRIALNGQTENRQLFERYSFFIYAICSVCCCCFLNLYQPFITLWLGADMLLDDSIVVTLCAYFYVFLLMVPGNTFENASGLWQYDRYRPLLEGLLNLGMNLVLVRFIGLYGILLSTIFSMLFFSIPWLYHNVTDRLLGGGFLSYVRNLLLNTAAGAAMCLVSYLLCRLIPEGMYPAADLVVRGGLSVSVPVAMLCMFYHQREEWKWICGIICNMFGRIHRQK